MNDLKHWLTNHSISAKTFIAVWGFVVLMWATNDQFRAYILGIYNALPAGLHNFIAGVAIPALILWRTQKTTTVTAEVSPGENVTAVATASVEQNLPPGSTVASSSTVQTPPITETNQLEVK